ncbi:MAG: TonB-dependent receptor [Oceanospirillaceae bacterium]|nr:TonB-dependent receptor [Oceanospirillaceae bacterium]
MYKSSLNLIAGAVRYSLLVGTATFLMNPSSHAAGASETDTKVVITGSRLKRTDTEEALPVTIIGRQEIEQSGLQSVADVLRNTTFNSFGSYRESSGNSFQGQANLSLRGLGASRTLILLNGKRLPPSPVQSGSGTDLNTLPLAAVERIEILSDGASAIYGSDAIGGVVNIILKSDFEGVELQASASRPTREGADENSASMVLGTSTAKSSILFGISYGDRGIIFDRDRPWSDADFGDGNNYSTTEGLSVFGNSFLDDATVSWLSPSNCADTSGLTPYNDDVFGLGGTLCTYNFADISANTAKLQRNNAFINATYEIDDSNEFYVQANIGRTESFGRYAPPPDIIPFAANDPGNPFPGASGDLYHRYQALGPRDNTNYTNLFDTLAGVRGTTNFVDYEYGARVSRYGFQEYGKNYVLRSVAIDYAQQGLYNVLDPFSTDPDILNAMRVTISRESEFKYTEAFVNATFDLFENSEYALPIFIGAEWHRDEFFDIYDSQSLAGQVGGSAGGAGGGDRESSSLFAETSLDVSDNFNIDFAVRYDYYSEPSVSATSPKISFRYEPSDGLVLRGSYGLGFRAPTLNDLYGAETESAEFARDFISCETAGLTDDNCPLLQYTTYFSSNPDLEPEDSETFTLGMAYQFADTASFTVDFWSISLSNVISGFSVQQLINLERAGDPLPDGAEIIRDGGGRIDEVIAGSAVNVAELKTDGLDFNFRWADEYEFGSVGLNVQVGYTNSYESSLNNFRNVVGEPGFPKFRSAIGVDYSKSDFALAWNVNIIDGTYSSTSVEAATGNFLKEGHVSSWVTHNIQLKYNLTDNGELVIGVRNILDKAPALNINESGGYNDSLYDAEGRVPYITFRQSF